MYELNINSFIDLNIFEKDYLYKTRILGFRTFKSGSVEFLDIYIQNHDDTYIVMSGHNKKNDDTRIDIQSLENIWDLKLHNICFDMQKNKCIDVDYYLPRHTMCIDDIEKRKDILKTNYFSLINSKQPKITFNLDKRSFKKCTSYDFLEKYFSNNKDYKIRRNKIKEDDDYTRHTK